MTGRALAFADPEIIRMATENFVPVSGDDWYQRRRQDAEGDFFRKVAKQAGKDGGGQASGGSTRQGIYCFTADGQLLAYKNAGQSPEVMRDSLRQALRKWQQLPEERRKPGGVVVEDSFKADANYTRTLPPGGMILNVWTRILDRNDKNDWCRGTCAAAGGDKAARDHMWLTEAEWRSLVPAEPVRQRLPLPSSIADRLVRYHLIDNTRGEPPMWRIDEVRKSDLMLAVAEVTPARLFLTLDGPVVLATSADVEKAERGYDVFVRGELVYDRDKKAFERIEIVAVGDYWGSSPLTRQARPGRKPLGVVLELSKGKTPFDRVPPQAARELGYLRTGR